MVAGVLDAENRFARVDDRLQQVALGVLVSLLVQRPVEVRHQIDDLVAYMRSLPANNHAVIEPPPIASLSRVARSSRRA